MSLKELITSIVKSKERMNASMLQKYYKDSGIMLALPLDNGQDMHTAVQVDIRQLKGPSVMWLRHALCGCVRNL